MLQVIRICKSRFDIPNTWSHQFPFYISYGMNCMVKKHWFVSFQSPGYPRPYPRDTECMTIVYPSSGAVTILVKNVCTFLLRRLQVMKYDLSFLICHRWCLRSGASFLRVPGRTLGRCWRVRQRLPQSLRQKRKPNEILRFCLRNKTKPRRIRSIS